MGARFGRAGNRPAERGDGAQGRCGNAHRAEVRCDEPHPVALAYPLLRYPARSLLLDRRPLHGRRQDVDHAMAADRSPPYRAAAVPGAARTREAMSQARSSRQRYRGFVQDYKQRRLDDAAEPGDSPRPARGERRASVREYLGLLQMALVSPVVSLIRLAVAVAVLLVLNWRLALTAMAVVPGAMLISFTAARRIRPIYRSMRKDVEHIDGRVGETFSGIRIVRAFRRELQELLNYMRGRHTVLRKELFAHRRELVPWSSWWAAAAPGKPRSRTWWRGFTTRRGAAFSSTARMSGTFACGPIATCWPSSNRTCSCSTDRCGKTSRTAVAKRPTPRSRTPPGAPMPTSSSSNFPSNTRHRSASGASSSRAASSSAWPSLARFWRHRRSSFSTKRRATWTRRVSSLFKPRWPRCWRGARRS